MAKADDPATWGTRAAAEAAVARIVGVGAGGIGIELGELGDGRAIGGIDLDTCRTVAGDFEPWAVVVMQRFGTYAEISPSGTGAKLYFLYDPAALPLLKAAMAPAAWGKQWKRCGGEHPPAIEMHLGNRYFAVTERALAEWPNELRYVETSLLLDLIRVAGPAFAAGDKVTQEDATGSKRRIPNDRSRSAIAFRKGRELRRTGSTFEEMVEVLSVDPETCDWVKEKGGADGRRELHRIWERSQPKGPLIRLVSGQLHISVSAAEDALIMSGLPIYQRGDGLVRPVTREVPASHGRVTIAAGLGNMTKHSLVDVMCASAEWEKYDARAEDWVTVNPPTQVAELLLSRHGCWRFPSVAGVITTPTLRPDGSLLTKPGFDVSTRLYLVADPTLRLHPAVNSPTRAAAEGALRALEGLLAEFPLVKHLTSSGVLQEIAKAVALSGLITPVVRGALPVAPLHIFTAPAPGSGKSYLVDTASMIATGRLCPVISAAPEEAETEKRLVGLLLAGYPIVSLDNVNGELGGDLLCQAVERPLIRIRRLGASDITEIESCVSMFATGNNIRVRGDMVRRSLVGELDPQVERPELRTFSNDPVTMIQTDRGRYVSAALVIVRAYIAAGLPGRLAPIASFAPWSDLVRSALVWLGAADAALSMEQARDDDPELGELRDLLTAWSAALGSDGYTVRQIADAVARRHSTQTGEPSDYAHPDLRDVVLRIAGERGEVNTKRLGRWLMGREGRVVGKDRFTKLSTLAQGGLPRWAVIRLGAQR